MRALSDRLTELEERLIPHDTVTLLIMPRTTEDQAREQWERQTGKMIGEEEFRRLLPGLSKIIVGIRSNEGTEECSWIRLYD